MAHIVGQGMRLGLLLDEGGRFVTLMDVPVGITIVQLPDNLPPIVLGQARVVADHIPTRAKPRRFEEWKSFVTHWSRTTVQVFREIR